MPQTQCWPRRLAVRARNRQLRPANRVPVERLACILLLPSVEQVSGMADTARPWSLGHGGHVLWR